MRAKAQRWGNSLAIRIPKAFAQEVGLAVDSPVDMRVADGALVVRPAPAPAPSLEELLEDVTPENLHGEVDVGPGRGREVW